MRSELRMYQEPKNIEKEQITNNRIRTALCFLILDCGDNGWVGLAMDVTLNYGLTHKTIMYAES
jgi:hypothetical protein